MRRVMLDWPHPKFLNPDFPADGLHQAMGGDFIHPTCQHMAFALGMDFQNIGVVSHPIHPLALHAYAMVLKGVAWTSKLNK